jgi:hypothetical protein
MEYNDGRLCRIYPFGIGIEATGVLPAPMVPKFALVVSGVHSSTDRSSFVVQGKPKMWGSITMDASLTRIGRIIFYLKV